MAVESDAPASAGHATAPVVALIGRPNVGKSSLFNRLVGGTSAIVSDEPGTTRDRHFAPVEWAGQRFYLVDTGGLMDYPREPVDVAIRKQVQQAIEEADLLLFVVDAQAGLHPSDARILDLLRDTRQRPGSSWRTRSTIRGRPSSSSSSSWAVATRSLSPPSMGRTRAISWT